MRPVAKEKAPSSAAPPLEQVRAMLEGSSGVATADVVAGVRELLRQHSMLLGKYQRARELLHLEWSQKP